MIVRTLELYNIYLNHSQISEHAMLFFDSREGRPQPIYRQPMNIDTADPLIPPAITSGE